MSQFVNAREAIVTEAIDGLIRSSGGHLSRLDGYPHIKVVLRSEVDSSKVAIVSGGGSGHEPSHAGFVGKGMLTAAVCGDVFASPSVDAVLAGILAVTGDAGCLLIVKNYTGDRLNFGLAAERARAHGKKVEMIIVDDDIALPELPQARGLAGTLFVHKIAGALAEEGADLDKVAAAARRVVASIRSIGMSLSTCTVPGSPREDRIREGKAELGLGIHGEPGVQQVPFDGARGAIEAVAEKLSSGKNDLPVVALLNNLGGASVLEMSVLAHDLVGSRLAGLRYMIGPASMMTSLDMRGFSVSTLAATDEDVRALSYPVTVSAWPGMSEIGDVKTVAMPMTLSAKAAPASENAAARSFLQVACATMISATADLNALDAKSGDGDTGSTLAGAAHALMNNIDKMPLADTRSLFRAISQTLSQTMGGSSGVLLAILFAAASDASSKGLDVAESLLEGLSRMQEIGGAGIGDRTMVDALLPALLALKLGLPQAAKAARQGANNTATMLKARSGRASYVGADQLAGHVDPGAEAAARLFEALSV
jgi:dihydroxyacetone kinase